MIQQDSDTGLNPGPKPGDPPERALTWLFQRYAASLLGLGRQICRSCEEAEDLVQDTFLAAYRAWPQYRGGSLKAWLFTIAANRCRRLHRRRFGTDPLQDAAPHEVADLFHASQLGQPADADPEDAAMRAEQRQLLSQAVGQLPAAYRLPVVFKDMLGLSLDEAASALGIEKATLRTRLHRARLKLREAVDQGLPQAELPPAAYPQQVCAELLARKQAALDAGESFPLDDEMICERCKAVFASLDLTRDLGVEALRETLSQGVDPGILKRTRLWARNRVLA